MRRPIGVTIIAILFLASAVYLWIGGATVLLAPGVYPFTERTLRQALRLIGPYPTLAVGAFYAVVGWGLFRLKNWARFVAMLVMTIGGGFLLPLLFIAGIGHGWSAAWIGVQLALRAVAVFYLMRSKIIDIFVRP
jgi:uncharacterized membrane protein (DUF2068 family)